MKSDLSTKTPAELMKELTAKKEELRAARFNVAGTRGLKTNASAVRKDIARIMTELSQRN